VSAPGAGAHAARRRRPAAAVRLVPQTLELTGRLRALAFNALGVRETARRAKLAPATVSVALRQGSRPDQRSMLRTFAKSEPGACEHAFVTSPGGAYGQFKRALARGNFMQAWTLAGEVPKVSLADGLALLLLARDVEPARFDRGVPRWHARLCTERRLSAAEAQLALAALNALPGAAASTAACALAALCDAHGLDREVRVLENWIEDDAAGRPARRA
jgi:hypothetical protein